MKEIDTKNDISSNATNKVIEKFQTICEAAQTVVDKMKDKERKQVKEIADEVAKVLQKETKRVLNTVNDFLHETECGYVSRGKHGGFIKGTKAVRIIKPQIQASPSSVEIIDEDENE